MDILFLMSGFVAATLLLARLFGAALLLLSGLLAAALLLAGLLTWILILHARIILSKGLAKINRC